MINKIITYESDKCFSDIHIKFKLNLLGATNKIDKIRTVYLTINNIITDNSAEIDCK